MHAEKISISLPHILAHFVTKYQKLHDCRSKSEVIHKALKLLQQSKLEAAYHEASKEVDPLFEITSNDGLEIKEILNSPEKFCRGLKLISDQKPF